MFSCNNIKVENNSLVDDTATKIDDDEKLLSSIITINNIVPLETNDSSLLGNISKIVKNDETYYIKAKGQPLMTFSETGKFNRTIGNLGMAPYEYLDITDFDIYDENVYILEYKRIQVYTISGDYVRTIPLSLNASGLKVVGANLLLFVLGDKHVLHLMDMTGNTIQKTLARNQALRLSRSVPFVKYSNKSLLFPQGRSNDIIAYNIEDDLFSNMSFLTSSDVLTIDEEVKLMESSANYKKEIGKEGFYFDGFQGFEDQISFFSLSEDNDIILWVKDILKKQSKAYNLSSIINDVTYVNTPSFFVGNTDADDSFLTYIMPYRLLEGIEDYNDIKKTDNYDNMKSVLDSINVNESNPIIIEYEYR